jgi:hypothetical protein
VILYSDPNIFHKKLKRINFNHKITSQKNQKQNQGESEVRVVPNITFDLLPVNSDRGKGHHTLLSSY